MSGSNALQITDPNAGNPLGQAPSWADAYGNITGSTQNPISDLQTWLAAQRAKSAKMGLWDDMTGLPTGAGLVNAAQQTGNALLMGTTAPGIRAFHGSPYDFSAFDTSKIGTGEGNQMYGHGLYFAEQPSTASAYQGNPEANYARVSGHMSPQQEFAYDMAKQPNASAMDVMRSLATKYGDSLSFEDANNLATEAVANRGRGYQVNINADPNSMLQWDQTVGQHPPAVRDKLLDMGYGDTDRGADIYSHMSRGPAGNVGASQRLQDAGIPGISYLDAGSRGSGQGTKNHVIFDANTIEILRKYGIAGLIAGGGAAAATNGSQQPQQ